MKKLNLFSIIARYKNEIIVQFFYISDNSDIECLILKKSFNYFFNEPDENLYIKANNWKLHQEFLYSKYSSFKTNFI